MMSQMGSTFANAKSKLEDARASLEALHAANDSPAFRSAFSGFLSSARAVTYALQKDGAELQGFPEWYGPKSEEMRQDELMRFIHEARTEDFHEGKHRLSFATHVQHLSGAQIGPPPIPGAALTIGADGAFWLIEEGTPRERRIPIRQANYTVAVSIASGPKMHQGRVLERNDPLTVCSLALGYLEELVHEARTRFGTKA